MVDKTKDGLWKSKMMSNKTKPMTPVRKKSALELDREITKRGKEYASPQMLRSQARQKKEDLEEKAITKKNANSLVEGIKGFALGSNRMDAKYANERNERYKERKRQEKEEEKAMTAKLRKKK